MFYTRGLKYIVPKAIYGMHCHSLYLSVKLCLSNCITCTLPLQKAIGHLKMTKLFQNHTWFLKRPGHFRITD